MLKKLGLLTLTATLALPALAATKYHCTDSENVLAPFTLTLATGPTRLAYHNHASLKSEEGQLNSGDYFWSVIGGHTRVSGLTDFSIHTNGDLGKVALYLLGDNLHLFGNGTVGEGASEETVLISCKVEPQE